jgi:hypothetical protein
MGKLAELNSSGDFEISASEVPLPDPAAGHSLQEQVQEVADRVTEMVRAIVGPQLNSTKA